MVFKVLFEIIRRCFATVTSWLPQRIGVTHQIVLVRAHQDGVDLPTAASKPGPPPYAQLKADGKYGVYQLAGPADKREANVDIVFFHGLQLDQQANDDAWRTTWLSREEQPSMWPEAWLPGDLNDKYGINARILAVSYKANATQDTSDETILPAMAGDILQWLVSEEVDVGGSYSSEQRRIVLVGHSLGGLVMKQLVVEADDAAHNPLIPAGKAAAERFIKALSGFVFYATPHSGGFLPQFVKRAFADALRPPTSSHLVKDWLPVFSNHTQNLNMKFDAIWRERKLDIPMCVAETEATELAPGDFKVVIPPASALMTGTHQYRVAADHFGVCQPPLKQDVIYANLRSYVREVVPALPTPPQVPFNSNELPGMLDRLDALRKKERKGTPVGVTEEAN